MMKNKIIVSSADSNYFNLLKELHQSLCDLSILNEYKFAVLDTGLTLDQLSYLKDNSILVKKAIWNVSVPNYKIRGRDHLKTQVARAYLPEYFPNYKIYIWLDADLWINDKNNFMLYEKGAVQNKLTITPQTDRSYIKSANIEWFFGLPKKIKTINYKNISRSISKKMARKYAFHATLNAGAFAISSDEKIWHCFQKNINLASKKGRIFGTDQVALALSVYEDNLPTQFLPAYCNWMCEFHLPLYDDKKKLFVEPYLPNESIALIHLAGLDDIRKNENILVEIRNLNGQKIKMNLRYLKKNV